MPLVIGLIGATGGTGGAILQRALARGHAVRTLVRNPAKLKKQLGGDALPPGITIVEGEATSEDAVRALLLAEPPLDVLVLAVGSQVRGSKRG